MDRRIHCQWYDRDMFVTNIGHRADYKNEKLSIWFEK